MNRTVKKLFSVLIAGIMILLFMLPSSATAMQEGIYTFVFWDKGSAITAVSGNPKGVVQVPDTLGGRPVIAIENAAFAAKTEITSVILPDTVFSIGEKAFLNCQSLESIEIPNKVKTINYHTFEKCYKLMNVKLPSELKYIEAGAFMNCYALASLTLPDTVMEIREKAFAGTAFERNEKNWDNKILYLDHMLVSVKPDIAGKVTVKEGITVINRAAFDSTNISEIIIPEGVEYIQSYAFFNCSKLTKITLPSTLKNIGAYAFTSCAYENKNTVNGQLYIGDYLIKGSGKNCIIKDGTILIGELAFANDLSVKEIYVPESVKYVGNEFMNGASKVEKITFSSPDICFAENAFYNASKKCVVYGYAGSDAETQAEANGLTFVAIEEKEGLIKNSDNTKLIGNVVVAVPGLTAEQLRTYASEDVVFTDKNGKEIAEDAVIYTGMVVASKNDNANRFTIAVFGDVDGDGNISAADARLALRASVDLEKLSVSMQVSANVNDSDDTITAADARTILRASVELEDMKNIFNS